MAESYTDEELREQLVVATMQAALDDVGPGTALRLIETVRRLQRERDAARADHLLIAIADRRAESEEDHAARADLATALAYPETNEG